MACGLVYGMLIKEEHMHKTQMNMKTVGLCLSALLLGGACLASGLAGSSAAPAPAGAGSKKAELTSIKGTYTFGGKTSDWSAKLTAKGEGTYDAVYASSWGGKPMSYVGTIKTDLKESISGTGKASGGGANGTFEFSGKFGNDGLALCTYKEVNGRRSGSLTAEKPQSGP